MHWTTAHRQVKRGHLSAMRKPKFFRPRRKAMRRSVHSHRRLLLVGLLAATGVVGLMANAILAQSNPPGLAAGTQDEPIKRTVLFRGDLEDAPGKEDRRVRRGPSARSGGLE